MKYQLLPCAIIISLASMAQPAKTKTLPKTPPATTLRTTIDSASYAIGISIATFYNEQGLKGINPQVVAKAISDVQGKKKTSLSEYEANTILMDYMNRIQESKAKPNIVAGEKFLEQNKTKPGVTITGSGLQYEIIAQGLGPKPMETDTVVAHYAGSLLSGEEFDNSYKRGEPITFAVTGVIKGWTEALQIMPVGSKYRLYIPHNLGYGIHESGAIPGGSVLVFDVELLSIKGK
jgi:FKBP-type peptidyl-prolyl cis-trans isomerase FklB